MWRYLVVLYAVLAGSVAANDTHRPRGISPAVLTEGFLAAHPDLRWRMQGEEALAKGNFLMALNYFKRAALYGDKLSQAHVAELHWRGQGIPRDRVLGYIWMDLAGERLYPDFILLREHYWEQLDERDRATAIERGQAVFAQYGDDVAKPRLGRVLERHRRMATGSRLGGATRNMQIMARPFSVMHGGVDSSDLESFLRNLQGHVLTADEYYDDRYWKPELYWKLQDEIWNAPEGRVEAGELEPVRDRRP